MQDMVLQDTEVIIITNYYFYVCLFDCLIFFLLWTWILKLCVCPINLYERLPTNRSQNLQFESPALHQKLWWLCHSCHYFVSRFDWIDWFETLKEYFLFFQEETPQKVDVLQNVKRLYMLQWLYIMLSVKCPKCVHYCNFPTTVFGFRVSSVERCLKCKT